MPCWCSAFLGGERAWDSKGMMLPIVEAPPEETRGSLQLPPSQSTPVLLCPAGPALGKSWSLASFSDAAEPRRVGQGCSRRGKKTVFMKDGIDAILKKEETPLLR